MREFEVDGIPLRMGRNCGENDSLLKSMDPEDTWFHLEGVPSAHLAMPRDYRKVSKHTLYRIALEVKKSSKFKANRIMPVMYTYRKNLILTEIPANPIIIGKFKIVNA
jgi:predicted ribosome quality control (RQC) complex YloA/Tae2 family protein